MERLFPAYDGTKTKSTNRMKAACLLLCLMLSTLSAQGAPLLIDNPKTLTDLESKGFSFSELLTGKKSPPTGALTNDALYSDVLYKSIADSLITDLADLARKDSSLDVTMAKKHRLFNGAWLKSNKAKYELVGVVPRFDRSSFYAGTSGRCGELRLIYRLAYRSNERHGPIYSRLPMTVNTVFWMPDSIQEDNTCGAVSKAWLDDPEKAIQQLKPRLNRQALKSVEINLQSVRWPSTVRPDFGGYAEYFLRVFKNEGGKMVLASMENMVDVPHIKNDQALRAELLSYLKKPDVVASFDQGVGTLPEKFLAKKTTSAAFHGMARLANRPFDMIIDSKELASVSFEKSSFVKSPEAYLRRLNDMTCVGCHQGRAIAGFHFVGIDREGTHPANSVQMAMSGHMQLDLPRREAFAKKLAASQAPDAARGFSERVNNERGGYGAHCAMGKDPSFSAWTCEADLECQSTDTATSNTLIGVCLPKTNRFAGDPCDVGRVSQHADSKKDAVIEKTRRACAGQQSCFAAGDGFPGGLCHDHCKGVKEGETCGLIAFDGFNQCLRRGESFIKCLETYTGELTLKACDQNNACRDDFVCARTKSSRKGEGACIPPYFLFQLRLDGHPNP
jgi:hypothetical protein